MMSLDLNEITQETLFIQSDFRTHINIPKDHPLVVLNQSISWHSLMEQAVPLLYQNQGISIDLGRRLNLRAHLGAYILQSVHNWSDRWTEEMLKYYVPARIFCGFLESSGSIDHTKIEEFRNRLGTSGSQLINKEVFNIAKKFGFTQPTDVDMDTTVQEAGITHPTEMKLLSHLSKRFRAISSKLKDLTGRGLRKTKKLIKAMKTLVTQYRFFAKTKEAKTRIIKKTQKVTLQIMESLTELNIGSRRFQKLPKSYQEEVLRYFNLVPRLLEQISFWIRTGKVAQGKIISLWKWVPQAIKKGKIGKPVEFGRKWVINCYQGGYVLLKAPINPKISDQHCVLESLNLHMDVCEDAPKTYATDRGMWSEDNIGFCLSAGIEKIGIQPKGQAKPLVGRRDLQVLSNRRAAIEPRIAHLKTRGLGKSRMKSDTGDLISGYRSALSYNLTHLIRDLNQVSLQAT